MAFSTKPMRRSQLISPWGVGAIVPFPDDESLMIAGLDMWRYPENRDGSISSDFVIVDERLQKRLNTKELRWPPDFRDKDADHINCNLKIPTVRFPSWHYCPFCGTMYKAGLYEKHPTCDCFQWPHGRKCTQKPKYQRKLIPERFVVVCPEGHIDDFPIIEWLHDGEHPYKKETCHHIRRSTGGTSAALTGVRYECSCGVSKSIASALRPQAFAKIGYRCRGRQPWLGIDEAENGCNCKLEEIKVLQRGATNVWFADTRSSIYIPVDSDNTGRKIVGILDEYFEKLNTSRVNGEFNKGFITMIAETKHVDPQELFDAVVRRANNLEGMPEVDENISENDYRVAEYKMLNKSSGGDGLQFHSIMKSINTYDPLLHKLFNSITLVPRLRETRAFVGFSRLEPNSYLNTAAKKHMLRLGNENWLPAIEVYGEGIFFEFNRKYLQKWAQNQAVKDRIAKLNNAYQTSFFASTEPGSLRAEFVLIHTFAHLLINQLSYECGYGSSSLRERLYCEKTSDKNQMQGVLIYTASGDSEGSLGGLVRQGMKDRIEDTVLSAVKNAAWCSSDPVCIQSGGQGPESCNLAACHSCALLPETSCECGNRLLDRALVIGNLREKNIGFFADLLEV